jgi:hypothetical protein
VTRKPDHRGERAISRKAIAQGMSDCLRCPVCSCAHLFVHIAHETAGAARIRHSLRPLFSRGAKLTCKPRADRAARTPMHIYSLKIESPVSAPQGEGSGRRAAHTHIPGTDAPLCRYPAPPAPINFSLFSRRSVHPRPPLSAKMSPRAADS